MIRLSDAGMPETRKGAEKAWVAARQAKVNLLAH
jgi:hypothetical protein